MNDQDLMDEIRGVETEMGAPGFWDQPSTTFGPLCNKHCRLLSEAVRRGLTTFSTRHGD